MPGRTTAGKRYAQAIAGLARQDNSWEQWRSDLERLQEALKQPELRLTLESPRVPYEAKERILLAALGQELAPDTLNLLKTMGRRGRLDLIGDLIIWFKELADRALGVRRFIVTSATPLDEQQRDQLSDQLRQGGGQVVLTEHVDPEILGGIILRHEDVIRDFSVRARLETLRQRLN
jgi:F-type H+-transporting ATPase subunit delta